MIQLRRTLNQSGFTIPELISVMVVTLMFTSLIMYFALQSWGATETLKSDLQVFTGRLTAGDRLRDSLNSASGLIIQNGLPDTHTLNPDPGNGTGNYWTPLHAVPGSTAVGNSGTTTPLIYYTQPAINSSKDLIMNGVNPYLNEFVLYLNGTTKQLMLRTLANPSASGNSAKTSCPKALASSSCPADLIIAENVSSISMRYFSRSGNTLDYTSIVDPLTGSYIGPDFPAVEVVEFNMQSFKKSVLHGGQDTTNQTIVRVALRNG
jgi:hypothetical protein